MQKHNWSSPVRLLKLQVSFFKQPRPSEHTLSPSMFKSWDTDPQTSPERIPLRTQSCVCIPSPRLRKLTSDRAWLNPNTQVKLLHMNCCYKTFFLLQLTWKFSSCRHKLLYMMCRPNIVWEASALQDWTSGMCMIMNSLGAFMDSRAPIVHKRDFTLRRRLSKCVVCDSAFKNRKSTALPLF